LIAAALPEADSSLTLAGFTGCEWLGMTMLFQSGLCAALKRRSSTVVTKPVALRHLVPAPEGALDNAAFTVCLKAYPDTNRASIINWGLARLCVTTTEAACPLS
jgi:hypothetical protein